MLKIGQFTHLKKQSMIVNLLKEVEEKQPNSLIRGKRGQCTIIELEQEFLASLLFPNAFIVVNLEGVDVLPPSVAKALIEYALEIAATIVFTNVREDVSESLDFIVKIRIIDNDPKRLLQVKKLIGKVLDVQEARHVGDEPKPSRKNDRDWLIYFLAYMKPQDNNPLGTIVSLESELEAAYEAYNQKCKEVEEQKKTIDRLRQLIGESPNPYAAVLGGQTKISDEEF
ncbi:MAG: hypothetical protein F6J93_37730 [Oscillatoria sp. SIO1A7]|nr:hypothetical protein [Oscillatoria sp. SIO1A7]